MSRNHRIFFDMDGVLVDFDRYMRENQLTGDEVKRGVGAYLKMEPIEHAIAGIRSVIGFAGQHGYDVWLATKPPTGVPWAYADKVEWVLDHLPELKRRIILTHDKGLLGDSDDILVDDRIHKANCQQFRGALIHFGPTGTVPHWHALVDILHRLVRHPSGVKAAIAHELEEPLASLEEINAARMLMRLGPIPESAYSVVPIKTFGPNPAGRGEVLRGQPIATRPVHGGYPAYGRFGGGRFGNLDAAGEERDRHPKA